MEKLLSMKKDIFLELGVLGSGLAFWLGGADKLLIALCVCVGSDYITGMVVALFFKKSPKTETGGAQSTAGFVGLVKKACLLMIVAVVNQVDIVLNANGFLRNSAIIGFIANECLSMVENLGLMGIKLPPAVTDAIDILKKKSDKKGE